MQVAPSYYWVAVVIPPARAPSSPASGWTASPLALVSGRVSPLWLDAQLRPRGPARFSCLWSLSAM